MPRAVDARLGDDGYGLGAIPRFRILRRQVDPLLKFFPDRAGLSPASLMHALSAIGTQYRKGAGRGADAFTRAQARKALDMVLALPTVACRNVLLLNGRAEDAAVNELMMVAGRWQVGDCVYDKLHAEQLDPAFLRSACEAARDRIIATKGADKNGALLHCASQLCEFYEEAAGARITLSNRKSRTYTQIPRSNGAQFVCEALMLIAGRGDQTMKMKLPSTASGLIRAWIETRSLRPVHIPRT